ncbi:retinitis pigmentosa 1-like 1 protein [Poeciliopsis prolifica]|uniref:retinitis pigmentosa 1-like 1 protein n=1 Tax=Poeciliopsis prolifica TaxID=188132 RepID=UPI00241346A7|nr:retinitis pigmentosa 1-like 1 protein [Poeciliopsis prolifica]
MKTLVLLFVSVTVAMGMPTVPKDPVAEDKNQPPVAGDWVPALGHVVVEHPAPRVEPDPKEQQEKTAPAEQKEKEDQPETKPDEVPVEEELEPEQEPAPESSGLVSQPETKPDEVPVEEELEPEQEPAPEGEAEPVEGPDFQVESDVNVEVEGQPQYELEEEEEEIDPGVQVQSAPRVDVGAHMKLEPEETPESKESPETFQAQAELDGGISAEMEDEERQPLAVMELEPLDDADMPAEEVSEMSEEEMAYREAFQEQDSPEEEVEEEEDKVDREEDLMQKHENNVPDEQEILELEPELTGEQNPEDTPDAAVLVEEPLDPAAQQTMPLSENYFPEEEAGMEMYARDGAPEQFPEGQGMEDEGLPMMMEDDIQMQGERYCPGMIVDGKCYQFFKGPLNYEDAELFCQEQFPGGHLGSITTQLVHQELMSLMRQSGGYTRTWVGGRRLDRRFVWLDGSRWSYEDWLPGEPNHTAGVENCVEILGNGKFNDFTCWEPQAFVCSYPA